MANLSHDPDVIILDYFLDGIEADTIIGDAAYSGKENLKLAGGQEIKVVAKLNPSIAQGFRKQARPISHLVWG